MTKDRRCNIVVGKPDIFICRHPHEPHDGPCERSRFVTSLNYISRAEMYDSDPECLCTDEERAARRCKIQCPPHWRKAEQ